jgi:hypothetical protein
MARARSFSIPETNSTATSSMENFKDTGASSPNLTNTRDSLKMESTMVKESTHGVLATFMKDRIKAGRNTGTECTPA